MSEHIWLIFERGHAEPFVFVEQRGSCQDMDLLCHIGDELGEYYSSENDSDSLVTTDELLLMKMWSESLMRPYGEMVVDQWEIYSNQRQMGSVIFDRTNAQVLLLSAFDDYKAIAVQGTICKEGKSRTNYLLDNVLALAQSDSLQAYLPDLSYGE